jgi:RNA polymerase II subunit A-like phosphatase
VIPEPISSWSSINYLPHNSDSSNDSQENSSQLHDISGIQVNTAEAARLDSESTRYLLSQRKLALIVDLDQTIIHATVDPTVGEWMKDTRNPNYKALENVGKFRLGTDGKAVMDSDENDEATKSTETSSSSAAGQQQQEGCWYYVKPRPGLQQFLAELAEKYEMYVYTMGTRSYAEGVCKLVDPQGNIFGARILSRDENGSLLQKSLKKLFPMDTSMVVIIDDRADVWKWSPNLLKVIPFDFFVGSGDINASFLPAAPTVPTPTTDAKGEDDGNSNNDNENKGETKDGENGKSNSSGPTGDNNKEEEGEKAKKEEAEATANAEKSQKSAVSEQLGSRPLAKMQEALDVKNDQQSKEQTKATTAVLKDDDQELKRLRGVSLRRMNVWFQVTI